MPKPLEEIKTFLESIENGSTYYEDILHHIDAEKQRGISEKNKANSEAANLRKFKIALEGIGYNPQEHQLDDFIGNLKNMQTKLDESKKKDTTLESLQNDFNSMQQILEQTRTQLNEEKTKAQKLIEKTNRVKMQEAIQKHLVLEDGSPKVHGMDLLTKSLIADGIVGIKDDNETIVYKDGDSELDLKSGIDKLLEQRKDLIRNVQKGGAGSNPNDHKQNTPDERQQKINRMFRKRF